MVYEYNYSQKNEIHISSQGIIIYYIILVLLIAII